MTAESYWTDRLRTFSLLDFALVKAVYFLFGLWALQIYPDLGRLDWWFYLALGSVAAVPLLLHWFAARGGLLQKGRAYIRNNNPALQILLFFAQFFTALWVGILIPALISGPWWLLPAVIVAAAIKPMTKTLLW